jgi:hypothetical protein
MAKTPPNDWQIMFDYSNFPFFHAMTAPAEAGGWPCNQKILLLGFSSFQRASAIFSAAYSSLFLQSHCFCVIYVHFTIALSTNTNKITIIYVATTPELLGDTKKLKAIIYTSGGLELRLALNYNDKRNEILGYSNGRRHGHTATVNSVQCETWPPIVAFERVRQATQPRKGTYIGYDTGGEN